MPESICLTCNKRTHWRNTRGSSQPKVCACGGELVAAVYTSEGYKPRSQVRGVGCGRKKVACALCGRMRMAPSDNVRTLAAGFRLTDYQRDYYGDERLSQIGPDDPLCWLHVERIKEESSPC